MTPPSESSPTGSSPKKSSPAEGSHTAGSHTATSDASEARTRQLRIFALGVHRGTVRTRRFLGADLVGGIIILIAAGLGIFAANSPFADGFFALRDFEIGPDVLGLRLPLGTWASDGLLAIFFFMVGLELKREFVEGSLSRFSTAIVPVAAAFGGVLVPALFFLAFNAGGEYAHGWAIPTATDIAFAVAVLGLLAPGIPTALRLFLLTLAVVDDFIAIAIIALFYTDGVNFGPLALSLIPMVVFAVVARTVPRFLARSWWAPWIIMLPLGTIAWALFHASGIHATIAGVTLAFLVPVRGRGGTRLAETFERRFSPLSTVIAVPIFAFFASGVAIGDAAGFPLHPVALGIMLGLVVGKPIGISLTTWLLTRFTRATLDPTVRWLQLVGVACLAGVGFTVSLLITDLSFGEPEVTDVARLSVMAGSIASIAVASCFLVQRRTQKTTDVDR